MNAKLALSCFLPTPVVVLLSTVCRGGCGTTCTASSTAGAAQRRARRDALGPARDEGVRAGAATVDDFSGRSLELASPAPASSVSSVLFSGMSLVMMLGAAVWYVGGREVLLGPMTLGTLLPS